MKEQLISFETAKLAKEKGFDLFTEYGYDKNGKEVNFPCCYNNYPVIDHYSAPNQSLLQKWLREKYNIHIDIYFIVLLFRYRIYNMINCECYKSSYKDEFDSYEQALEQGLQEALKLIQSC